MLKKMIFTLICLLGLCSPVLASEDNNFDQYLSNVAGLDGNDPEQAQKAAHFFVAYVQAMLPNGEKVLAQHLDYPVLVNGKTQTEKFVLAHLQQVFTPKFIADVRAVNPKEDIFVRGDVEYCIGEGAAWFYFPDNNLKKVVIFAINNI